MTASDVVETLVEMAVTGRVLLARALAPELRRDLRSAVDVAAELPFVRGETVLPDDLTEDDVVVIGHPNFLGGFDPVAAPHRSLVVYEPSRGAHRDIKGRPAVCARLGTSDPAATRAATLNAGYVARRLSQIPNVRPAFSASCPVIVVLLPIDPGPVAHRFAGTTAIAQHYPELPGGLRIDVPLGMAQSERGAYAADLERAIGETSAV